jgi:hypothetical protein
MPIFAQDIAYPRYSPLLVRSDMQPDQEYFLSLQFGTALHLLEQGQENVIAKLPDGTQVIIRSADVYIPPSPTYVRHGPGMSSRDRARIFFWDSPLRAESFLRHGPSELTRPFLQEAGLGAMPEILPVLNITHATGRSERSIRLINGVIPMAIDTLAFSHADSIEASRTVMIHILVDGSVYTRDFSQRQLHELSRMLEARNGELSPSPQVRQTVLYNTGDIIEVEGASLSGLRRLLPQGPGIADGTLSSAFLAALEQLQKDIASDEMAEHTHIIAILLGPGLDLGLIDDPTIASFAQEMARLTTQFGNIGLLFGSVTPEPTEIPARILSRLGRGLPYKAVDFGVALDAEIGIMLREIEQPHRNLDVDAFCARARDYGFPCLSSVGVEGWQKLLPHQKDISSLEWFSLPMWFVADENLLVVEAIQPDSSNNQLSTLEEMEAVKLELLREKTTGRQLTDLLKTASIDRARLQEELDSAQNMLAEAQLEIHRIQERTQVVLASAESRINYLQQELVKTTYGVQELERLLRNAYIRTEQSRVELGAALSESDILREALEAEKLQVSILDDELRDVELREQTLQRNLDEALIIRADYQDQITSLELYLAQEEDLRREVEALLATANKQLALSEATFSALQLQFDQLVFERDEFVALNATIASALNTTAAELERNKEGSERLAAEMAQQQLDFDSQVNSLEAGLARSETALESTRVQVLELEAFIMNLEVEKTQNENEIKNLTHELETVRGSLDNLNISLTKINSELQLAITELDRSRINEQMLMTEIAAFSRLVSETESELASVREALALSEEQGRVASALISTLQSQILTQAIELQHNETLSHDDRLKLTHNAIDDRLELLIASQAPALRQTLSALEALLKQARTIGEFEPSLIFPALESAIQTVLTAEFEIGTLISQKEEDYAQLLGMMVALEQLQREHVFEQEEVRTAYEAQIGYLQAESDAQKDKFAETLDRELEDLHAIYASELSNMHLAHAAELESVRSEFEAKSQASFLVLLDLVTALGVDLTQRPILGSELELLHRLAVFAKIKHSELQERAALAEVLLAQSSESVAERDEVITDMTDRLAATETELQFLREQMQVAIGVANENIQLLAGLRDIERQLETQNEAHRTEVNELRRQLVEAQDSKVVTTSETAMPEIKLTASSLRPRPRPEPIASVPPIPASRASRPSASAGEREATYSSGGGRLFGLRIFA